MNDRDKEDVFLKNKDTQEMINLVEYSMYTPVKDKKDWVPVTRNIAELCLHNRKINLEIVEV